MVRLVTLGLVAATFFSSTFILNRLMSLEGGHWAWTSALRWLYVAIYITIWLLINNIEKFIIAIRIFRKSWSVWFISGTSYGIAYTLGCFSILHAPGWIIATVWQITIVATPAVLFFFGKRVPTRGIIFITLIFLGILLIQAEQMNSGVELHELVLGIIPIILASFLWPAGNQFVKEATQGTHSRIQHITDVIAKNATVCTLLISLGSIPFWSVLLVITKPGLPTKGQLLNTAIVAISSGVIGMIFFLKARQLAKTPYQIAAVDATQAWEIPCVILGEMILFSGIRPHFLGMVGITLVMIGIILYTIKYEVNH